MQAPNETIQTQDFLQSAQDVLQSERNAALVLLESLVNLNTYSDNFEGVGVGQELLKEAISTLPLSVSLKETEHSGPVLVASRHTERPFSLLLGHIDTVHPPESDFRTYSAEADIARGPGVLDMKAGLVQVVWALRALHRLGGLDPLSVKLVVNSAEETGSERTQKLIEDEARGARETLVFEYGRRGNAIIVARKGVAVCRVAVKGKASHAGNAHHDGVNAIVALCAIVPKLSALTHYARGISVNVGTFRGGSSVNTVPAQAEILCEFRFENMEAYTSTRDQIHDIVRAHDCAGVGIRTQCTDMAYLPPLEKTAESEALFRLYQAAGERVGVASQLMNAIVGGGSDGNFCAAMGIPTIDGLGPFGEFPHSDKEYVSLSSLEEKTLHLLSWLWTRSQEKA